MHPLVIGNSDNEVVPTHPWYNIPPKSVYKAVLHFQENNYDLYCEQFKNGIWGDDDENEYKTSKINLNQRVSSSREGSTSTSSQMSATDESIDSVSIENDKKNKTNGTNDKKKNGTNQS